MGRSRKRRLVELGIPASCARSLEIVRAGNVGNDQSFAITEAEDPLMTPEEIQRTMDFVLRSQADSVIRMERIEADHDKLQQKVDTLSDATRNLLEASHNLLHTIVKIRGPSSNRDPLCY